DKYVHSHVNCNRLEDTDTELSGMEEAQCTLNKVKQLNMQD
ncbi:unnamed protein product, partial [Rotaria sp. Silwood2]